MKIEFSRRFFEKYPNTKFNENPSVEAEFFHVDRETERQTDMTKLIIAFPSFANEPIK